MAAKKKGQKGEAKPAARRQTSGKNTRPAKPQPKAKKPTKDKARADIHDQDLASAGRLNSGILKPATAAASVQVSSTGKVSRTGQQPPTLVPLPAGATVHPVQDSGGHDPARPIGQGNPPRRSQIQPGQVLNPKGYPKGRPNAKTVIKYWLGMDEQIPNPFAPGTLMDVTVLDSMTLALINKARQGSVHAYRELLDRIEGKPVQSTKLLNADDKILQIQVGFQAPTRKTDPPADSEKGGAQ